METEPYETTVRTDENSPRHKIGDTLYVDPNVPPHVKADVVFYYSADVQRQMLGELVRWDETAWHIKQYRRGPEIWEEFITLSRAEWPTCHVVIARRHA